MILFIVLAFAIVAGAAYVLVACGDSQVCWMLAAFTAAMIALAFHEARVARRHSERDPGTGNGLSL